MAIADDPTLAAAISSGLLFLLVGGLAGSCDPANLRRRFTTADGFKGILAVSLGLVVGAVLLMKLLDRKWGRAEFNN